MSDPSIYNLYGFNGFSVFPVQSSTNNILLTKGTVERIVNQAVSAASSVIPTTKEFIELDFASGQNTFTIVPYANKTIVTSNTTIYSGDITLNIVDVSHSTVGDELVFIFNNTSTTSSISMTFTGLFYATFCGGGRFAPITQSMPTNSRNVTTFIFDGAYFSNTYDNC